MKYGLPIPNIDFQWEPTEFQLENDKLPDSTPNTKLWTFLRLSEETPYEVYELELKKQFNYEMELYGSETNEMEARNKQVLFRKFRIKPSTNLV